MSDRPRLREALDQDMTLDGGSYIAEEYPSVQPIVDAARRVLEPDYHKAADKAHQVFGFGRGLVVSAAAIHAIIDAALGLFDE